MRKIVLTAMVLFAGGLATVSSSGCLGGACRAASPLIQRGTIYADDATAALNRVQLVFDSLNLDTDARKEVAVAMAKAWEALRASQALLMAASDACSGVDVMLVFADFISAWKNIEMLLSEHATASQDEGFGAYEPAIVRKASQHE